MMLQSRDVLSWSEWEAFRKRLGIPDKKTLRVIIEITIDEPVKVLHEYFGEDVGDDDDTTEFGFRAK